ncbi:hypothetical protein ACIN8IBEIGE_100092 [Acinetobacter sp. 8I-beige]|uniref:LamG-like jellyroll fold domain-containing protein n=1 Tax=Acinetobacter sp. 8I-beige TaxID=2653125 RepID=UPI0012F3DB08|nr:LamG-like jellyroll fold domain-containing protein [Acinetobacter sp. 8I-beige]VXA82108.1 hypothetical protein ACIN8IBEIGE_100092 [Acinetobacter sp. 8I-beige]
MAGVRLEFAQFGHFDYFNIYRNSVSTAIENLEQPIGTSSTMYYEDLTTEPNNDYYYRIGVVRDSIEEFSEEIHVRTEVMFDPPYNLIVEFKNDETNRLELNWSLDGFVDEQRYYCSETPIELNALPVPKAFLAGDVRTYVDNVDIHIGRKKYIVISSIKSLVEKVSSQKLAYCLQSPPKVWSEFKENLNEDFGTIWTARNGAAISNNALKLVRSSAQRVDAPHSDKFHFSNSEDVTIRFKAKISSFASDRRVLFTTRMEGSGAKNWCIYAVPNGINFLIWRSDIAGNIIDKTWSSAYQFNEETEFSLERKNMIWRLYVNGNLLGGSITQNMSYTPLSQKLTIGSEFNSNSSNDKSRDFDGEISMFQILPTAIGNGGSTTPRI